MTACALCDDTAAHLVVHSGDGETKCVCAACSTKLDAAVTEDQSGTLVERLHAAASPGADTSPGDPLAAEAEAEILALRDDVDRFKQLRLMSADGSGQIVLADGKVLSGMTEIAKELDRLESDNAALRQQLIDATARSPKLSEFDADLLRRGRFSRDSLVGRDLGAAEALVSAGLLEAGGAVPGDLWRTRAGYAALRSHDDTMAAAVIVDAMQKKVITYLAHHGTNSR